jgi:signal peptidase II
MMMIFHSKIQNTMPGKRPSLKKSINKRWLKIALFCLSSLTLISWDRVTKDLAKEHLKDKPAYSYLHDSFRLQYVENTGAAMSLADDLPKKTSFWLLGIIPLGFMIFLLVYTIKKSRTLSPGKLFAFSLIFAGGIGNILDRLLYDRHVTDFMNVGILNFRTGIFNFADVWITSGIIYLFFFHRQADKNQKPPSAFLR